MEDLKGAEERYIFSQEFVSKYVLTFSTKFKLG
uniref:Uncharacterized protein n=1 Tax=Anguilla anguilla TaxID=7936 RepID=A0A0E9PS01_ANGAN